MYGLPISPFFHAPLPVAHPKTTTPENDPAPNDTLPGEIGN